MERVRKGVYLEKAVIEEMRQDAGSGRRPLQK